MASAMSPPFSLWCVSDTLPRCLVPAISEGALFTSRSHTLKSLSIRTSKPKSSKCRRALVFGLFSSSSARLSFSSHGDDFVFRACLRLPSRTAASPATTAGCAASTATMAVSRTSSHTPAHDDSPNASSSQVSNRAKLQLRLKCAFASGPSAIDFLFFPSPSPSRGSLLPSPSWCSLPVASALFVRCLVALESHGSYKSAANRTKPSAYTYARGGEYFSAVS
mmetsp:Transcript_2197/g.7602  ORF Transcript_2197/g.7602 Transcript_2197/m.7602 type:complete len:222 (+) Transcript_2197:285-950(+)